MRDPGCRCCDRTECFGSNGTRHNQTQPSRFIFTNAEQTQPGSAEKTREAATWPLRRGLRHTCESGGGKGMNALRAGLFLANGVCGMAEVVGFVQWILLCWLPCVLVNLVCRFDLSLCRLCLRRASVTRPPTPEGDEDKESEPTLQEIINVKLIESGEKERLKELLRERLVECGWRDELKAQCRAYTRKRGRANITVDELVRTITPRGRATVPDNVKAELLQRIRVFLMSDAL